MPDHPTTSPRWHDGHSRFPLASVTNPRVSPQHGGYECEQAVHTLQFSVRHDSPHIGQYSRSPKSESSQSGFILSRTARSAWSYARSASLTPSCFAPGDPIQHPMTMTDHAAAAGSGRPASSHSRAACSYASLAQPIADLRRLCILLFAVALVASTASAQTPQAPPQPGFILHEQTDAGRFTVQRWVNEMSPEVSPAGFCECITVVYEGTRLLLNTGLDAGITHVQSSTSDITGDGRPELVVVQNSGGAHCCESTAIYSVESTLRQLLSISTGNCPGRLEDIDGDGVPEFETCDEGFAYAFCSFAYSPVPTVVFAYDKSKGAFALATPRYARYFRTQDAAELADARKLMAETRDTDPETYRCAALDPALTMIYNGRLNDGLALFRRLYARPDRATLERKVMEIVRKSSLWIAR